MRRFTRQWTTWLNAWLRTVLVVIVTVVVGYLTSAPFALFILLVVGTTWVIAMALGTRRYFDR